MILPSVSCVIPCFNYGRFLGRAIDSALAVDYPADKLEIIVVDDGSTDETPDVIASYGVRIRGIHQENAGANAANETGIAAATGELIAFLDADDEWLPDRLKPMVEAFADPEVGVVYGDMELIDADGAALAPSFHAHSGYPTFSGRIFDRLVPGNFISAPSMMVRASLRERFMPFPSYVGWHDWYIALQVSRVASVAFVDRPVSRYRQHGTNSNNGVAEGARFTRVLRKEVELRRWIAATTPIAEAGPAALFTAFERMLSIARHIADADGVRIGDVLPGDRDASAAAKALGDEAAARGDRLAALEAYIRAAAHDPSNRAARAAARAAGRTLESQERAAVPVAPVAPQDEEVPSVADVAAPQLEARSVATLAFADELLARPDLLGAYAAAVTGADDATLVVVTEGPADAVAAELVELIDALAPVTTDPPDVVLLDGVTDRGESLADRLAAVLTDRPVTGELRSLRRAGVATADRLRALGAGA